MTDWRPVAEMDWLRDIDNYCERLAPGWAGEPLNALSNLAFVVAAVLLWRRLPARGESAAALRGLAALVLAVGLASAVFHTTAQLWSAALDIGSIAIFIAALLFFYCRRVMAWGRTGAAAGTLGFLAGMWLFERATAVALPKAWLNGSEAYLPALLGLLAMAWRLRGVTRPGARRLFAASAVLAAALLARSVDQHLCGVWPFGTHIFWHLLNGLTFYLAVDAMALATRASSGRVE